MSYHTGCSYKIRKFQPGQSSVDRKGGGGVRMKLALRSRVAMAGIAGRKVDVTR